MPQRLIFIFGVYVINIHYIDYKIMYIVIIFIHYIPRIP